MPPLILSTAAAAMPEAQPAPDAQTEAQLNAEAAEIARTSRAPWLYSSRVGAAMLVASMATAAAGLVYGAVQLWRVAA